MADLVEPTEHSYIVQGPRGFASRDYASVIVVWVWCGGRKAGLALALRSFGNEGLFGGGRRARDSTLALLVFPVGEAGVQRSSSSVASSLAAVLSWLK